MFYVYITTNKTNSVLYTGMTNNLEKRMFEHKNKLMRGFTAKYNIDKLAFYDVFNNPYDAIAAEKKIKSGSRQKKINLIKSMNPDFKDLVNEIASSTTKVGTRNDSFQYIFFGTPEFASIVLEQLVSADLKPIALITNPDRPAGRNKDLTAPPIKQLVLKNGWEIEILQPEKLEDPGFAQKLELLNADVFVVAAYGKILPEWLIKMPPKGVVGVHPSLLPKYRGASPIQSSILNGDKITGTTIFVLDEKVDHGPVLSNKELEIEGQDNYESLMRKLAKESGKLLAETLPKYLHKETAPHPQDEDKATYTKKFTAEDAYIPPESLRELSQRDRFADARDDSDKSLRGVPTSVAGDAAISVWRKIRALNPEPGTWTLEERQPASAQAPARQRRIKILEADFIDGKLKLKKIQYEGKNPTLLF